MSWGLHSECLGIIVMDSSVPNSGEALEAKIMKESLLRRKLKRKSERPKSHFRIPYSPGQDLDYLLLLCCKELEDRPDSEQGLFIRASVYLKKGQVPEALADCNAILQRNPQHAGAFYVRGCAYEQAGKLDLSFADFTTALALDPSHVNAAYAKATCQNKMGNLDQAIDDYCSALDLDQFQTRGSIKPSSISTTNCSESASVEELFTPSNRQPPRASFDPVEPLRVKVDLRQRPNLSQDQQAEFCYLQGASERKQKDFAGAVKSFDKALTFNPKHYKALFSKAFCLEKLGLVDSATAIYSEVVRLDPTCAIAFYNRGISFDKAGFPDKALADFNKAISLDSSRPDFYHNRGLVHKKLRSIDQAISDFTFALRIKSDYWKSLLNRAHCHELNTDRRRAVSDFLNVLQFDPENQVALEHLAKLYKKGGNLEESLNACSRLVTVSPTPEVYILRALAYESLGKVNEAVADLNSAIELERDNAASWSERGSFYARNERYAEALSDLTRALELDPQDIQAYSSRALVYRKTERYVQAIDDYTVEMKLSEPSIRSLSFRGYCAAKLDRFEDAISDFTEVLSMDENNMNALFNRGISLVRLGEHRLVDST